MSREDQSWLNRNVLVGYTAQRGNAWHYSEWHQGEESNHYEGAIPVEDVERRLFSFTVDSQPVYIAVTDEKGQTEYREVPGRKALVASDTSDVLGLFRDSYQGHQYSEWLLDQVASILSADLQIGGAGLLANRAQAYVQVEMPENIVTPEGVEFRPMLLATTSFDGTIATTYKRTAQVVVCDNTREMAIRGAGESFKVKHTRHSSARLNDARQALSIVHGMADDFAAEVAALCSQPVTDRQFDKFLNLWSPLPEEEGRSYTVSERKRDEVTRLYRADERAATWHGTAYGVLQAVNTYGQHMTQVRQSGGVEVGRKTRIMESVISGNVAKGDANTITLLAKACNVKPDRMYATAAAS